MTHLRTFPKHRSINYTQKSMPSFSIKGKILKFICFVIFSFIALNIINAQASLTLIPDSESVCSDCILDEYHPEKDAFSFCLKESAFAAVIFMDSNGKVLRTIKDEFNEGVNTVSLSEFKGQGVLYYTLEFRGYSKTRSVNLL